MQSHGGPSSSRSSSSSRRWLRELPVARKLAMIVILWVVAFVGLGALGKLSADILTSVRAYVGGEGLWAKSQRDTVFYLVRYAQGRDESDCLRYREALRVNDRRTSRYG